LKRFVFADVTEELGERLCSHLPMWKATCGGDLFIKMGMQGDWKDPVESPRMLLGFEPPTQHKFDERQQHRFDKILTEQLKQGIIVPVPFSFCKLLSPVFMVEKKGGEMRMVWDGRILNR
jgi:hypothetical protein